MKRSPPRVDGRVSDGLGPLIQLADMGSFHVGGRTVKLVGKEVKEMLFSPGGSPVLVDPNGLYQIEQMYVQYFIPHPRRGALPLLMWHGGGMTGVAYESTPDGREGWLNFFIKKGWAVYNSDAVERGRAGWASFPELFPGDPVFMTTSDPFERFRIGDGRGSYSEDRRQRRALPGTKFPLEGYDQLTKQMVPRWTTTDDPVVGAYSELVKRVGSCVILAHSQAGLFSLRVARGAPDQIKGLILVEPASLGDAAAIAALKDIPVLAIFGDYVESHPRWSVIRRRAQLVLDEWRAAGGDVDVIDLPEIGISGNSHLLMMDRNNIEIAGLIHDWLEAKGLY